MDQDDQDAGKTVARPDVRAAAPDAQATLVRDDGSTVVRAHPDVTPTVVQGGAAASDEGPVTPESAGRYQVRSEYGRGGQSRVLLAFDTHVQREIALKELLPEGAASGSGSGSQAAASRFVREARITGQLEHPNIVPVYELGRHEDGTFYYTQKLVRGTTLKKKLAEARTLPERLKLLSHFEDICHAVAYAHSRGVIHRDLKPENVMVGQFGETVVLDWGLAKARGQKDVKAQQIAHESELMRSAGATMAGYALGTPSYMSPEQAQGKLEEIDERSDVWSLGAILFETLTGCPPFQGGDAHSVISKVIRDAPPRTRAVLREAPPELAAVADKCLSRAREERYASAEEVAKEIEAYLTGGDVRAYQYSSWELLRRFVQKHRALTAVSAGAVLLLVAALLAIREEAAQAKAALAAARHNLAQAYLEKAHIAEHDLLWHEAEIFLAASRVQEDGPEARWGSVIEAADAAGVTRIAGARSWVTAVAFSPDGKSVAAGEMNGTVREVALDTGRQLRSLPGRGARIVRIAWAGNELVARDAKGGAIGGAIDSKAIPASEPPLSAAEGPNHEIRLTDRAGKPLGSLEGHTDRVTQIAVSPDGARVASASLDRTVRLWDAQTLQPLALLPRPAAALAVAFSPDGQQVAVGEQQNAVVLWNVASGRHGVPGSLTDFAFLPHGGYVAAGNAGVIGRWDRSGKLVAQLRDAGPVSDLALSADGKQLATVLAGGGVSLWDLQAGALVRRAPDKARAALITPRGLLLRFADGSIDDNGRRIQKPFSGEVEDWLLQGDILVALAGGRIQRYDLSRDKPLADAGASASAIAACGSALLAGSADAIALLDPATLAARVRLDMDDAMPISVACSADGRLIAASGLDGAAHIYDVAGGREVAHLPVAGATSVKGLAFSPDGKLLHLQALGSVSSLGRMRFVRIGDPATLPPPAEALQAILREHGVQLAGGEISALPQAR